jgi:hypothetical protein
MKKCKRDKSLESKVMKIHSIFIVSDSKGRYIPYCDFGYHRGLIIAEEVCKQRHCDHYYKLYIEKK